MEQTLALLTVGAVAAMGGYAVGAFTIYKIMMSGQLKLAHQLRMKPLLELAAQEKFSIPPPELTGLKTPDWPTRGNDAILALVDGHFVPVRILAALGGMLKVQGVNNTGRMVIAMIQLKHVHHRDREKAEQILKRFGTEAIWASDGKGEGQLTIFKESTIASD